MEKFTYPAVSTTTKTGAEKFCAAQQELTFGVLDFWRWMGSDLTNNAMRGVLAEFIVAKALAIDCGVRVEWDAHDLVTSDGTSIEIKSAAYCQSWAQRKLSTIGFDISPKLPDNIAEYDRTLSARRPAEIYVFCLLHHQEKTTLDPLQLEQWTFYVLPTRTLDKNLPTQKRISLSTLLKLQPLNVDFSGLCAAVTNSGAGHTET